MVRGRKNISTTPVPSRATRSSVAQPQPQPQPANLASDATESSTTQRLPKLRIPAGKSRLLATPTASSTPTTTRAPSPSRSSPEITPPLEFIALNAEVHDALNSLMGPGSSKRGGIQILEEDVNDSEESDSEVEILDDEAIEEAWSPILKPEPPRKDKRKRGESDVSRDQVSCEESPGSGGIAEENEEEEAQEESEEEELEDIDIPFQVPFEGAVSTEIFSSGMSWIEFRSALADLLSLAPSAVKVAYRFSVQPRSTLHTHLRNSDDLVSLFEKARAAQAKHGKSKSSKEFYVELKDLEPSVSVKQKGKKKDTKKKKRGGRDDEEDDDISSEVLKDPKDRSKWSQSQWVPVLWKDNSCEEHSGKSCLKFTNQHYQLSISEIGAWAALMVKGWNSTTNPPRELKLGDAHVKVKPKATKPEAMLSETASSSSMPVPPVPPTMGFPGHGYPYPSPYLPYGPPVHAPPWATGYGMHTSHAPPTGAMPSSDPLSEDIEDVTLFPRISAWLLDLDNGPRGVDGHNFSTWVDYFAERKYIQICDIADGLTPAELSKSSGMAEGTAKRLISYSEVDTQAIRKKEKKRIQVEKARPRHYV